MKQVKFKDWISNCIILIILKGMIKRITFKKLFEATFQFIIP